MIELKGVVCDEGSSLVRLFSQINLESDEFLIEEVQNRSITIKEVENIVENESETENEIENGVNEFQSVEINLSTVDDQIKDLTLSINQVQFTNRINLKTSNTKKEMNHEIDENDLYILTNNNQLINEFNIDLG